MADYAGCKRDDDRWTSGKSTRTRCHPETIRHSPPVGICCEAGEQRGAIRCGVGGAKDGDQGECGPAKHALDSEPGSRVTGAGAYTASNCRHTPEVGAVCGKAARTDPRGGRSVMSVPTATIFLHRSEWSLMGPKGATHPLAQAALCSAGAGLAAAPRRLAISTARMPTRKMPSKVPAPPIEATGAPSP